MSGIPESEAKKIANRLRRAQGQLGAVLNMVEDQRDCRDIVTQLAAVSSALDRAGFAIIAAAMKDWMREDTGEQTDVDMADLEKLFMSLA